MKAQITEVTHEQLVDLFSTGLSGCEFLGADYDRNFYDAIPDDKREGDCFEDHLADVILNGGKITLIDYEAEGEVYSKAGKLDDDGETVNYSIGLQEILEGCSTEEGLSCAVELWLDGEGDYYTANNLLQVIMFGEVVYG